MIAIASAHDAGSSCRKKSAGRGLATIRLNYLVEWPGIVGEVDMGPKVGQNKPQRQTTTRAALELAIAEAVRAQSDCGGFVSVIVERVMAGPPGGPNWTLKGARYGKSDRELCGAALSACVAEKQLQFDLSD
jgi:hypothetical protein